MYLLLGSAALFVAALPFDEHAQASPSAIPDNARCAALRVPDRGFINYSGDDWSCEEGFRRQESACLALPSSP
jgi:hypothetical protein